MQRRTLVLLLWIGSTLGASGAYAGHCGGLHDWSRPSCRVLGDAVQHRAAAYETRAASSVRDTPSDGAPWLPLGLGEQPGGGCPADMIQVESFCIDRRESPNLDAELPLVMYTFFEAEAWCQLRGRRLCYDDEWTRACAGPEDLPYPYGETHLAGVCNDEETWISYNQTLLDAWPAGVSGSSIDSLEELLDAARAVSSGAADSADHVEFLYQGEASGTNGGCVSAEGVLDLCGNVEEWTRRRDGGTPGFSGALKGRYWAESRTCQETLTTFGNGFRFYELGFRCCREVEGIFSDGFESGDTSSWSFAKP